MPRLQSRSARLGSRKMGRRDVAAGGANIRPVTVRRVFVGDVPVGEPFE
jgi:hypothetical protein